MRAFPKKAGGGGSLGSAQARFIDLGQCLAQAGQRLMRCVTLLIDT
jgi:hypothetical protein